MPRFSIVVPAYNAGRTFAETLDALLCQEFKDWECVVVDDGSEDDTAAIASRYAAHDPRIRMVSQANMGSAGAYNTGVSEAAGDYVVVCSTDDVLLPQHLAYMSHAITVAGGCDIFSSNGFYLYPDGSRKAVYVSCELPKSLMLADVISRCFYSVGATYRRELFAEVGGYRVGVFGEDYDFWLRAMAGGARHRYVPELLSLHRVSPTQKSANVVAAYRSDMRLVRDLRRDFTLSPTDDRAVDECIWERERLIARILRPPRYLTPRRRAAAARMALRLLGEERARRLFAQLKSMTGWGSLVTAAATRTNCREAPDRARDERLPGDVIKALVIPSWYPSVEQPTAGVFIHQQVKALEGRAGVVVVYVREAAEGLSPRATNEGRNIVVRAQLKMPPVSRTIPGRARAVATNLFNKFYRYPRTGLAAFAIVRDSWGIPDIVHVQALWPAGLIACAIKRRYGIPYVVTEHSEEYLAASERRLVRTPGVVRFLLRPLARGASRTIVVSRFLAERLTELGLAVDPVVIPNVVPVTDPVALPVAERHAIAHVSIMGPAKNLGALLQAVDRLRRRRTDFLLRLIGDGESRIELERMAAALQLDGVVEFTGRVPADEVRLLLAGAAFSVVSSTHETFSVAAAESLMCGRAVLSTRCGGPEEFITCDVGRLIDAGSVEALVEGLDWMLDHFQEFDPKALHRYAVGRFAPDVVAERILAVYRSVLDGR